VFNFKELIDTLRTDRGWTDQQTLRVLKADLCPESREAVNVENQERTDEGKDPMNYLQTRALLAQQYGKGISEADHYHRLFEQSRQKDKTVQAYANTLRAIIRRIRQLDPDAVPSEKHILRSFKHGLAREVQIELKLHNVKDLPLRSLARKASEIEQVIREREALWQKKEVKRMAAHVPETGTPRETDHTPRPTCVFCKKKGHLVKNCRAKNKECFKCGSKDHAIAQCPDLPPSTINAGNPSSYPAGENGQLSLEDSGPAIAQVTIGDSSIPALLDNGSGPSFISRTLFERLRPPVTEAMAHEPMKVGDAFGRKQKLTQQAQVSITLNERTMHKVNLWIAEELAAGLLLGRDFLIRSHALFDYESGEARLRFFGTSLRIASQDETNDPDDQRMHLSPLGPVPEEVKDLTGTKGESIRTLDQLKETMTPRDEPGGNVTIQARNEIATTIWFHYRRLLQDDMGDTKHVIRIPLSHSTPIARKPHAVSCKEREVIRKEMEKLEEQGIIEITTSAWAAPVLIVPKANGKLRPCVDYRALNERISQTAYPVPNARHILMNLRSATYRTVIDIRGAFWNLWVHPEDRDYTAFVTPDAQYRYLRMPMGISPGPSNWQAYMDKVLLPLAGKGVFAYLDDIIFFSSGSASDHASLVQDVLKLLHNHDLRIQPEKCQWMVTTARYLGHVVSRDGIHVQSD
jgi:hypothetical protein